MAKPGLPKLIATDLDGTLVRSDDTVSAYTHEVLERVRAAGIRLVAATGRGPRLTRLTRDDIRNADFLVLAQGGWVIDQVDGQILRNEFGVPAWPSRTVVQARWVEGPTVRPALTASGAGFNVRSAAATSAPAA